MTAATEETPAAEMPDSQQSADPGDPASGLTEAELKVIAEASAQIFKVCCAAASRTLAGQRAAAEQAVTEAEAELEQARVLLEGRQAAVDALKAEMAECQRQAGEVQLARDDQNVQERIRARSLVTAIAEETAAVEQRLQAAVRTSDPFLLSAIDGERKVRVAKGFLAALDQAIATPFFTRLGIATVAHERWLAASGAWFGSKSPEARELVLKHLRATGLATGCNGRPSPPTWPVTR